LNRPMYPTMNAAAVAEAPPIDCSIGDAKANSIMPAETLMKITSQSR
jgi:hypothetical protein